MSDRLVTATNLRSAFRWQQESDLGWLVEAGEATQNTQSLPIRYRRCRR